MKYLKLFEEYRYIALDISRDEYMKDPDEPFFVWNKKPYLRAKREERTRNRINNQIDRDRELFLNKKPLIEKLIKIIKETPDEIFKFKYDAKKEAYAILLKDRTLVVSIGKHKCCKLEINRENIPFYINKKSNKEIDPLGEDDWYENEKSLTEQLGDLVREYILYNDIVLF